MRILNTIRARATYANVTATLALFVALGGGSFAVAALSGSEKTVVKKIAKKQAKRLINKRAPAFQTASASDARNDVVEDQGTLSPALSTTITTSGPRTLTAVASVTVQADGGGDDNMNCRIVIDDVPSENQSTYVNAGFGDRTTLPVTFARPVGRGTHTVLVQCSDGIGADTLLDDRYLTVVATG